MLDHQLCELAAINENDLTVDIVYVLDGILGEIRGRDEDPFSCPLPLQGAGEFLDLGALESCSISDNHQCVNV